ncbi:MAG: B12-binding domain-containing protein [bacterium]
MPQATDFHGSNSGSSRTSRDLERLVQILINGDRVGARDLVREYLDARSSTRSSHDASDALRELAWPACGTIDALARRDQISTAVEQTATVLLAQLVQRIECGLTKHPARCREVMIATGPRATEQLAGEILAGIAEADGFDVHFLGAGIESDELFASISARQPAYFISFAATGSDAPRLRRLLNMIRTHDPVPGLRIGVGGGVFNRAAGLGDEIGADFEAACPFAMLDALRGLESTPTARRSVSPRRPKAA